MQSDCSRSLWGSVYYVVRRGRRSCNRSRGEDNAPALDLTSKLVPSEQTELPWQCVSESRFRVRGESRIYPINDVAADNS